MMLVMIPLPALPELLSRLDEWYAAHLPAVHATLRPGVTDADLDDFEIRNTLRLPPAFRALYRWHDGQDWSVGGVFGLDFMPLTQVDQISAMWQNFAAGDLAHLNVDIYVVSHPTGAIREQYVLPAALPFLSDGGGNYVALDLAPDLRGQPGQIVTTGRDEIHRYVLAPELETFLREYLSRLETGRVTVQALDGFGGEMWGHKLHDASGPQEEGHFRLTDCYPGFSASPDEVKRPTSEEDFPLPLTRTLEQLDAWLHLHHSDLLDTLPAGARAEELLALEGRLGRSLPEAVKALYRQHRDWGDLFGARSIPVDELGHMDPVGLGPSDTPQNLRPFSPEETPSTSQDWLPLWEAQRGFIGVDLAQNGKVRTFGTQLDVRYVLAENLTRLFDRYLRFLEAGLIWREGNSLRVPDAAGQAGESRAEHLFPGFGASPARLN